MSAYVVGNRHINALVNLALLGPSDRLGDPALWPQPSWFTVPLTRGRSLDETLAARRQIDEALAQEVGQMLTDRNIASVNYRYLEDREEPAIFDWQSRAARPTALEGLKAIACYEYQASEDPAWDTSEARAFCSALRAVLVPVLPGFGTVAGWAWAG